MNYAMAREQILDGDLIAVRARNGLMPALIRGVTRSPYTHTAVAVWTGTDYARRLLVAESNAGGCSLSPLSHYEAVDFDVFDCPVDRRTACRSLWDLIGAPIAYSFGDLFRIAANRILDVPLPSPEPGEMICSALTATIYLKSGWAPSALPTIPAPDDVVRALRIGPTLEVRSA